MGFERNRRGSIMLLAVGLLFMLFAFAAFAIDIGYISLTKAELQKSADAAALAANLELYDGWGPGASKTQQEVAEAARAAAVAVAAANAAGGLPGTYVDPNLDVRLGHRQWNPGEGAWEINWGDTPYNVVEVTTRRNNLGSLNGDRPLDLWFAPILGTKHASLSTSSISALQPAAGIRKLPGQRVDILPYALDIGTWNDMLNGIGPDNFSYNPETGEITNGPDGIIEVDLFPYGNPDLPPGNRGTVDFGSANNSTADIARQILYGLNEYDLSFFGGHLDLNDVPMVINGDTGISAGVKDELEAIKGQPRIIPLFSHVSGPGNNAMYTVVKFVSIRIVYVQLTGKPSDKKVWVQAAPFFDPSVTVGDQVIYGDSILAPVGIIQ